MDLVENHVNGDGGFEEDEDFINECGRFTMFESLARREEQDRSLALDRLERALKSWREKVAENGDEEGVRDAQKLLSEHLWSALALRWNAPFPDVRLRMNKLLEDAQVKISVTQGEECTPQHVAYQTRALWINTSTASVILCAHSVCHFPPSLLSAQQNYNSSTIV